MRKLTLFTLISLLSCGSVFAAGGKNSAEYREAYQCALTDLKGGGFGDVAACVGNSRDPSKLEEKAYADAQRDFKRMKNGGSATAQGSCAFHHATWIANGTHADGFEEGLQQITNLKAAANLVYMRDMKFYDSRNMEIPWSVAQKWFYKKGDRGVISPFAKKTCNKAQLTG
ncbi:hypothetical protein [Chromobacterium violaceum]|uniref:hypothetical protein n=1 Tax=Chromobacterium violaceum TaxID=536 RepID=UPI0009D99079|nr:hypothetical protein [Chromobacterium violaceum]OQS21183.1 hypothetical protein B0T41_21210 [Chromobacterium violaceum]